MNNLLLGIGMGAFIVAQVWLHLSIRKHKKDFKKFQQEMKKLSEKPSGTAKAWLTFRESR